MKYKLLVNVCLLFASTHHAQPGLFFNVSGGYGAPALQQTLQAITFQPNGTDPAGSIIVPLINQNISDSASLKFQSNAYQGYSNGGTVNFVAGYMISHYVGLEIGFASLFGKKLTGKSVFDDPATLGRNVSINTTTWSYGITMSPSIRLQASRPDAAFVPYGRFGLTIPFWGKTIHELDIAAPDFLNTKLPASAKVRAETQSVFSIGFNGSVGVGYNITTWLRVFGEAIANYLFVRSGKTTLTRYDLTFNGETSDLLPSYTTYSKVTSFVDKLDENSNTTVFGKKRAAANPQPGDKVVNEDAPREELRRAANFSAFGFNLGFTFTINNYLWKKKDKRKPLPLNP
ncbi:MAG: outer membrane beta-barrel protein [Chitinophagales bacterium]|nr:outer membrane beta-barrel protein [Chitinophagales bacterium]MDW8273726.1 outer membrane beta-barrel protein [Chitinophagales bacterium]